MIQVITIVNLLTVLHIPCTGTPSSSYEEQFLGFVRHALLRSSGPGEFNFDKPDFSSTKWQ